MTWINAARDRLGSLTTRLILVTTVVVVTSSVCLSLVFIHQEVDRTYRSLLENGALLAEGLAESARYSVLAGDSERIAQLAQAALAADSALYAVVIGRDGEVLAAAHKPVASRWFTGGSGQRVPSMHASGSESLPLMFGRSFPVVTALRQDSTRLEPIELRGNSWSAMWSLLVSEDGGPLYDVMVPIWAAQRFETVDQTLHPAVSAPAGSAASVLPIYGVVAVGISGLSSQRELQHLIGRIMLVTLFVIVIGINLTVYTARRITAPLIRLRTVASQIAHGDWDVDIPMEGGGEVGDLGRAVGEMTASLQARDRALRELTQQLEEKVQVRTQDLETANERLRDLDRLKTELVSSASHELRTPLTSIKMHVDNLHDGVAGRLSDDQRETLQRIRTNIDRLRRLLEDLLDLSRVQAGGRRLRLEPLDLRHVLQDVAGECEQLATQKQLVLRLDGDLDGLRMEGDRAALGRVFMNIMENAIKFSSAGGVIRIQAERAAPDLVTVTIGDQGCGIASEDLPNVFLPFFRAPSLSPESKGAGLGLAIAKQLVEAHQGAIDVRSELGCGSEFRVTLPARPDSTPDRSSIEARPASVV